MLAWRVSIFLILFIIENEFTTASEELNFRLPNTTLPESYDVSIRTRIDQEDFAFYGTVKIGIIVVEPTTSIILHELHLHIEEVQLQSEGQTVFVEKYTYNTTLQFLTISVLEPLISGNRYILQIRYRGTLREDVGFYRSSYLNDDGTRVWLATTQFQAADARHAFPCRF